MDYYSFMEKFRNKKIFIRCSSIEERLNVTRYFVYEEGYAKSPTSDYVTDVLNGTASDRWMHVLQAKAGAVNPYLGFCNNMYDGIKYSISAKEFFEMVEETHTEIVPRPITELFG